MSMPEKDDVSGSRQNSKRPREEDYPDDADQESRIRAMQDENAGKTSAAQESADVSLADTKTLEDDAGGALGHDDDVMMGATLGDDMDDYWSDDGAEEVRCELVTSQSILTP